MSCLSFNRLWEKSEGRGWVWPLGTINVFRSSPGDFWATGCSGSDVEFHSINKT